MANQAIAGALILLMMACGGVAQMLTASLRLITVTRFGLSLSVLGAFCMILSGIYHSTAVMLLATIVEGVGNGLAFKGGLGLAATVATGDSRAQVVSSYYVAAYTGFSVPVFFGGLLSTYFGLVHGLLILTAILGLWTGVILLDRRAVKSITTITG